MVNGITARLFMPITILMAMIVSRKKIAILTVCIVTGITAGNPDKHDSNGEYIYGAAPEAQVIHAGLLRPSKTTSDAIYIKAIECGSLGADSIIMSLGSATGSVVKHESQSLCSD